jgi:hypothetical protein
MLLAAIPRYIKYYGVSFAFTQHLITDFFITICSFLVIGLSLYVPAWLLGAKGTLLQGIIVGFYLLALWPYTIIHDYLMLLLSPSFLKSYARCGKWLEQKTSEFILEFVLTMVFCVFFSVKSIPAIKYVYSLSTLRATIATILGLVLMFSLLGYVLEPIFMKLLIKGC